MITVRGGRILLLVVATLGVAAAHFLISTGTHELHGVHVLLAGLSLPVIAAGAIWYGLPGGALTAGGAALLYLVHIVMDWHGRPLDNAYQWAFASIYLFVGILSGSLVEVERRETRRRMETERDARRNTIVQSLSVLDQALGLRDGGTLRHSENVSWLACRIARELGLSGTRVEELRLAALVHDIGKIGVRDDILLKPGKLIGAEVELMHRHPETAARILESIPGAHRIAQIVLSHHERLDGQGYPRRLSGEEIPEESRILAVADAFCALTEERPYHLGSPFSCEQALRWIESQATVSLDPAAVLVLRQLLHDNPALASSSAPDVPRPLGEGCCAIP